MIRSGDLVETQEGIVGVASEWVDGVWSIMTPDGPQRMIYRHETLLNKLWTPLLGWDEFVQNTKKVASGQLDVALAIANIN